jgi:hypothetical protein
LSGADLVVLIIIEILLIFVFIIMTQIFGLIKYHSLYSKSDFPHMKLYMERIVFQMTSISSDNGVAREL